MKKYSDLPGDGGSNIVGQVTEQMERVQARLEAVRRIVVVMSGKGGVGKSAITANLAAALSREGAKVGALDGDVNGPCLARMVGAGDERPAVGPAGVKPLVGAMGVKVMSMHSWLPDARTPLAWKGPAQAERRVWQGTIETGALRQFLADTEWGELDFLLVDLPPGATQLPSIAGLLPSGSGVLVVTIPSSASHLAVGKSLALAQQIASVSVVGLLENMGPYECPHCGKMTSLFANEHGSDRLAADFGVPFLGSVPFDPRMPAVLDEGTSFIAEYPSSPAAAAIEECARVLRQGAGTQTIGAAT